MHELLQRAQRARRWPLPPEGLDQPVRRDHRIGVDQKRGEQEAHLRAAQRHGPAVHDNLERTEHSKRHALSGASHRTILAPAVGGYQGNLGSLGQARGSGLAGRGTRRAPTIAPATDGYGHTVPAGEAARELAPISARRSGDNPLTMARASAAGIAARTRASVGPSGTGGLYGNPY